jgi:hypothetical protein
VLTAHVVRVFWGYLFALFFNLLRIRNLLLERCAQIVSLFADFILFGAAACSLCFLSEIITIRQTSKTQRRPIVPTSGRPARRSAIEIRKWGVVVELL